MQTTSMLRVAAMLTAAAVAAAGALTYAQQAGAELQAMPIRGNVFVVVGAGSNVTVSAGVDGLLLVDTGSAAMADKVLA